MLLGGSNRETFINSQRVNRNAIDAYSTRVEIEIKNGGKDYIRVSDNGIGMSSEDAGLAFCRHATSKIRQIKDLFSIKSLGFRGGSTS